MPKLIKFLQLFADDPNVEKPNGDGDTLENKQKKPDTKTFTQEEMDKIVVERIAREKKANEKVIDELKQNIDKIKKEQSFKDLSDEERAKKQLELEAETWKKKLGDTEKELQEYRKKNRNSEILQEYNTDKLPRADLFIEIAPLIANIDDETTRSDVYSKFVNYVNNILMDQKKELFKGKTPDGSSSANGKKNPFKEKNFTEIARLISENKDEAITMAKEAGLYDQFASSFNKH